MGKYFGTDGFRGEANKVLTVTHAYKIGRFIGWYFGKQHKCKVAIGKDTRRSSYMFEYALTAGITASGGDAYLLHVTTTPSVSYVVRTDDFDCGIMISASHNPFYDNGIKLLNNNGEKMNDDVLDLVEQYLDSEEDYLPLAVGKSIGITVDYIAGRNRYIGYLISLALKSYKNYKIGLDCANGSTWQISKSIFDALGAHTYVTGNTPDGTNINDGVGSTHIENLKKLVLENNLDIGFAFDGDADRCLAVDEKGNIIDGDKIMYACAKYMKNRGELNSNIVVTTVMSNIGLYEALNKIGIKSVQTDVGDRFVYEEMLKNNYSLGGEESGHIIFSRYATTGDGLITAIKFMEVLIESKDTASSLFRSYVKYPKVTTNVRVFDKNAVLNDVDILSFVDKEKEDLGSKGKILFRKSGTEPLVRITVEAMDEELCNAICERIALKIKEKGYALK